jgi:hypothetical protein
MTPPTINWTPEFVESHDYYGEDGDEYLEHGTVDDYLINEVTDGNIELDIALAENDVISVYAYNRMKANRPKSQLDDYIYEMGEGDGMGDPNGDHEPLSKAEYVELEAFEKALIDRLCELYEPWGCEQVAVIKVPFRDWFESLTDDERKDLRG